jgi:hypothetical protein
MNGLGRLLAWLESQKAKAEPSGRGLVGDLQFYLTCTALPAISVFESSIIAGTGDLSIRRRISLRGICREWEEAALMSPHERWGGVDKER